MGNTNFKTENLDASNLHAVSKANFVYHFCIGKGGFGKVWRVERKKAKQYYAMKEMSKARIITKRSVKSVINERQILAQLQNVFIVNMYYAFQDRENLYLVMDYLSGGDLRYHICRNRRFSEEITRFFVACLVEGLEYIHEKKIIHRDIKPENLVIESDGYLRITDFGIARVWREENAQDTSGTPGYMAPEVMCRQNHTCSVDFFAVGVMAYEMMFGRRPYIGKSRKEIRDHILSKQIQIKRQDIPRGWSVEAADFINKMIQRKPQNRLGSNGADEVKNHPWLRDFPWKDLEEKKLQAPFVPPKEDNFDQKNINEEWRDVDDEGFKDNFRTLRRQSIQDLFAGYYYDFQVAAIAQNQKVIELGFTNMIMQQIQNLEQQSQMQDPTPMATSSSQATLAGIYSTNQLPSGDSEPNQHLKQSSHSQQISHHSRKQSQHQVDPRKQLHPQVHHKHNLSHNDSSASALSNIQVAQPESSAQRRQAREQVPVQSVQNNFMNDPVATYAQNNTVSSSQRPLSNTASSTLNAGITSQHSHSHSYSQSLSHNNKGHSRHASKQMSASHTGGQHHGHHGHSNSVSLQQHIQQQSHTLNHSNNATLSASYLHPPTHGHSNSAVSSAHKRNVNSLTQSANISKQQLSHVQGSRTQIQSSTDTTGLGLSLKHQQIRQSQQSQYQQQFLQAQAQQALLLQQQREMKQRSHQSNIKIQPSHGIKAFQGAQIQQFAKSECPTPKSREIDARHLNQQKFFSRKSSNAHGTVQTNNFTNLNVQNASNHLQQQHQLLASQMAGGHSGISRQSVQSQGHSRRQSGRSSEISIGGTVQHFKQKAADLQQSAHHERNGFSNRKTIGGSYHVSSLSFSKNKSHNHSGLSTVHHHQPYSGGIHSHNSSIHSSQMKSRAPGVQHISANAQNIAITGGGGHHKNSLSMGTYETAKVKMAKSSNRQKRVTGSHQSSASQYY